MNRLKQIVGAAVFIADIFFATNLIAQVFDYSAECSTHSDKIVLKSEFDVPPQLQTFFTAPYKYISLDENGDGTYETKLVCFESRPLFDTAGLSSSISINAPTLERLVISGLNLPMKSAGNIVVENHSASNHVVLDNVTLSGFGTQLSQNAIKINGSINITIQNSHISASQNGIAITEGAHSENITIENSSITGNNAAGSIGVDITAGAKNVKINNQTESISGFKYGIHGEANVFDATFKNIDIPICQSGNCLNYSDYAGKYADKNVIGKRVDPVNLSLAKEITGLASFATCNEGEYSGVVDMYKRDDVNNASEKIHAAVCPISKLSKKICMRPIGVVEVELDGLDACPAGYLTIESGQCVFGCPDLAVDVGLMASFSYKNSSGVSYLFSEEKKIGDMPDYATFAPATPAPADPATTTASTGDPTDDSGTKKDDDSNKLQSGDTSGQSNVFVNNPTTLLPADQKAKFGCTLIRK